MTERATDYEEGVAKLERELAFARRNGGKALREMYAMLAKELRVSERELRKARSRSDKLKARLEEARAEASAATRRAKRAEQELAAVKSSTTWKAGRAVVGLPGRVRRIGRR